MRIGIFGGSFNPIHNSHLALCAYAKISLSLDKLILIPTGDNPYKNEGNTSRDDRLEMTKLAVKGLTDYEVNDIEIKRPGQSFTVDTIKELKKNTNADFYFISGSDILLQLGGWRRFDELAHLTNFAVVKRKNIDNSRYIKEAERLNKNYKAGIYLLEDYMPKNISSTMVRNAVENGQNFESLVPEAVYEYIIKNKLYLKA